MANEYDKSFDLELEEYIFNNGMFYLHFKTMCTQINKKTPFYESYKGSVYDTLRLVHRKENSIKTTEKFSLKEILVLGKHFAMQDDDLIKERILITSNAFAVIKSLNYLFELSISADNIAREEVFNNGKTIKNNDYFELVNWSADILEEKIKSVSAKFEEGCHILERNTIRKTILDIIDYDGVRIFNSAVGYAVYSSLALLGEAFDKITGNKGRCKLIIGSLQNYPEINKEIDRKTAITINMLIEEYALEVFTYDKSFYHGKLYCLEGEKFNYYIVGSSNISANAFKNNYEMDILYITVPGSELDIKFKKWYLQLENECNTIPYLDEERFQDFSFKPEDKFQIANKISINEAKKLIDELSDEETRFRLNVWLQYGPSIYNQSVVDIPALSEYSMFVYENDSMVVFESFKPKNRYYVFGMPNGIEDLLIHLKEYTKSQMTNSEYYVERGNHVKNKKNILSKINRLFV